LLSCLVLLAVDTLLLRFLLGRPISGTSFILALLVLLSLPLLLYLAYRTWGCFSLEYRVDRDGVTIVWGPMRRAVPMGQIERIVRGGSPSERPRRRPWPGPYAATCSESPLGQLLSYATRPPAEQLLLVTPMMVYGISPAEQERFLAGAASDGPGPNPAHGAHVASPVALAFLARPRRARIAADRPVALPGPLWFPGFPLPCSA
jgi:hypothetical protein